MIKTAYITIPYLKDDVPTEDWFDEWIQQSVRICMKYNEQLPTEGVTVKNIRQRSDEAYPVPAEFASGEYKDVNLRIYTVDFEFDECC